MADILSIQNEVAQDEQGVTDVVYQKSNDPYLAPDGVTPCTITVLGSDAKAVRLAKDAVQRKLLQSRRAKLEPADILQNRIEIAAAAVLDWFGWTSGDTPFPCTRENVRILLSAEHILVQVESLIDRHASFFAGKSSN